MRKHFYYCLLAISSLLFFSGCETNTAKDVKLDKSVMVEEPEIIEEGKKTDEAGNEAEDSAKAPITFEEDKSYIYKDLCKVSETYDEINGGASIETVVSNLRKESFERMILISHNVEENVDACTDTVKYQIIPKNPSGIGNQYINCTAVFEKSNDEWFLSSKEWDEWEIKRNEFNGSNWLFEDKNIESIKSLWGGESLAEDAEIIVHFKKNLNIISAKPSDDHSLFEVNFGTSFSGSIYAIGNGECKSVDFTCTEGYVNDDGILAFNLVNENGEISFIPGEGNKYITDGLYKYKTSENPDDFADKTIAENLDTFEVKSESVFYGSFKKEIGAKNGNISPDLSWDKVDGAASYAIMMIDLDLDDFHLHGFTRTDSNHLAAGEFEENGYLGPYPPSPHNYKIYVFALRENADDVSVRIDMQNCNIQNMIDLLNKSNPGNVISYGELSASYEYLERVW